MKKLILWSFSALFTTAPFQHCNAQYGHATLVVNPKNGKSKTFTFLQFPESNFSCTEVDDAAKKGTDKFYIKVAFGKILKGKSYEINGGTSYLDMPLKGSGKATLMESGSTKTVVVEGKTADGVGISATIKCNSVITAG